MEFYAKSQLQELSFEVLQTCPNNCIYCSSNSCQNSTLIIGIDIFKKVLDDAVNLGLKRLSISGGEPFLHPALLDMIGYAKQKKLEVYIYTSGISMENGIFTNLSNSTLYNLKELNLDKMIFNVQACTPQLYDKIMGTFGLHVYLKESIRNSVKAGLFTEIHFVPMKINYQQINSVIEFAKNLNVQKISFLRLVIQGRALKNKELIEMSEKEIINLKKILCEIKKQNIDIRIGIPFSQKEEGNQCCAGFEKLTIRYDGAVYPCEAYKYWESINDMYFPENIKEKSLNEIWHNSKFIEFIQKYTKNFRNRNYSCEVCPAQWLMKNEKNFLKEHGTNGTFI